MKKHLRTIVWSVTALISGSIIGFTVGINIATDELLPIIYKLIELS